MMSAYSDDAVNQTVNFVLNSYVNVVTKIRKQKTSCDLLTKYFSELEKGGNETGHFSLCHS